MDRPAIGLLETEVAVNFVGVLVSTIDGEHHGRPLGRAGGNQTTRQHPPRQRMSAACASDTQINDLPHGLIGVIVEQEDPGIAAAPAIELPTGGIKFARHAVAQERLFPGAGPFQLGTIVRLGVGCFDQSGKLGVVDPRLIGDRFQFVAGVRVLSAAQGESRPIDVP